MENSVNSYLSLGSNLGDREDNLSRSIELLNAHPQISVMRRSKIYETEPVGMGEVPWFLNQVIYIQTNLPAMELLAACKDVESTLGRRNKGNNEPRIIDVDILTYGNEIVDEVSLQIPHPRMNERLFVLYPLSDIAPDYKEALQQCKDSHKVTPYESRTA